MNDPVYMAQLQARQMQQFGQPFQLTPMLRNNGGVFCGMGPYAGC